MSNKIDQRIVEMSFENHKFEKGILESKNSLRDFSKALDSLDTGKDFNGLTQSFNSLSSSLSLLEQVGIGALRRLGEVAVNAGGSLVKSLSVDQLTAGLSKYEEKINAVQTMVSAGYNLDEVERSMAQLMWFSDETSYSFADMAGNMAKFISAGVELNTAGRAMQGIATWAAHSGKNSQAASIAMFNLSQAISMGYVDTMNWRSIMNQNMNTTMFKKIAISVAEATGAIKEGDVTIQNFDSNLRDKWFTNDILLKTLDQYSAYAEKVREVQEEMNFDTAAQAMEYMDSHAEDYADVLNQIGNAAFKASQESKSFTDSINATMDAVSSGWLRTYEIIFGTLDEAKANFSGLTEILWTIFASSAEGRNEMLQSIKELGGVGDAFQTLKNIAKSIVKPLQAISAAFDAIFPPRTQQQWMGIITSLKTFSERMIISDETAGKLARTFAGLFATLDTVWSVVKLVGNSFLEITKIFLPISGSFLDITASIGDFLVVLNYFIKTSGIFQTALLNIKIVATTISTSIGEVVHLIISLTQALWNSEDPLKALGKLIPEIFGIIIEYIQKGISWISGKFVNALSIVAYYIEKIFGKDINSGLSSIFTIFKDFIDFIVSKATSGIKGFSEAIDGLDFNKIASFAIGGVLLLFVAQLNALTNAMTGVVNTTNTFMTKFQKKLFGTQTKIKDLAFAFGVVAASLYILSDIPWDDLKKGLIGLAGALTIFVLAYAGIQTVNVIASKMLKDKAMIKSAFNLVSLASGLVIMAGALKIITSIQTDDIWRAVGVVGSLVFFLGAYQSVVGLVGKFAGGSMAVGLGGITAGLLLLIASIKIINKIDDTEITAGLNKIGSILVTIGLIQLLFSVAAKITTGNKLATGLLDMAAGILLFVGVIKLINNVSNDEILSGMAKVAFIGAVTAALQALFATIATVDKGKKVPMSMLAIAGGVMAMLGLIKIVNLMTADEILMGTVKVSFMMGMLAAMQAMFAAANNLGKGKVSLAILAATASMAVMTGLISIINVYTPEQLQNGIDTLIKMGVMIGAIQFFTGVAAAISDGNKAAASILSTTVLVSAMAGIIALLSVIPVESLHAASNAMMNGAIAIGILLGALSIFSYTAQDSIPKMLGLAASLVIFAGAITLLAIPISALSQLDSSGLIAAVLTVTALIGVFGALGALFNTLGVGTASLLGLSSALILFSTALTILSVPMAVLASFDSGKIITTTLAFAGLLAVFTAMGFLNGGGVLTMSMIAAAGGVAAFGASLIVVAGAIALAGLGFKLGAESFDVLVNSFTNLINTVRQNRDTLVDDFKVLGSAIGEGIFSGIKSFFANIGGELKNVWSTITTSVKDFFDINSPSVVMQTMGTHISGGLWNGLKNGIATIKNNIGTHLSSVADAAISIGSDISRSIGHGIKRGSKTSTVAAINMAQDIEDAIRDTTGIHSISDDLSAGIGEFVPLSIVDGIKEKAQYLLDVARKLGMDTGKFTLDGLSETLVKGEGAVTSGLTSLLELLTGEKSITELAKEVGGQTGDTVVDAYGGSMNGPAAKAAYKDAFELFKESIDKRKEYNLISLGEELAEWEKFAKKYASGTEIRMKADKEVTRVKMELQSKEFENSKRWIEEEKYYKRLSLLDELAAWERVQKRYEEGHAYRIQAERELFRVKQEIQQAEYDNWSNWIEEEKYYKRLSLRDELAAWSAIQNQFMRGTEQRKKADREVFRLQEELATKRKSLEDDYYNKTAEINAKLKKDISDINKTYADAVESRAKTLYNSYRLFDSVTVKDPIDGEELLTNLEDQVIAFESWQQSLMDLSSRGVSEELINELKEMGPSAVGEIQALNLLTDEQLTKYVDLWQQKHKSAKDQATLELEGMRLNTIEQIKLLENSATNELRVLKNTFDNAMQEVASISTRHVQSMRARIEADIAAMNTVIKNQFQQITNGIQGINSAANSYVPDPETYRINRQKFAETYKDEIVAMSKLKNVDLGVAQSMLESEMRKNGEAALEGLNGGIESKTEKVADTLKDIAVTGLSIFGKIWDMNSPSKAFFKLGVFGMQGLTGGFINQIDNVEGTSELMALTALNALSPALSEMYTLLEDMNIDPTITPVLDLSNIKTGREEIGKLLNDKDLSLSAIASKKASLVHRPIPVDSSSDKIQTKSEASYSFVQNNYSPKPLSRIEIYRQTRNQFSTLKGLVRN